MAYVPTGRGLQMRLVSPPRCPNGHRLRPPNVQCFYLPGGCGGGSGHHGWRCWTCLAVIYEPEHGDDRAGPGIGAGDESNR